MRGIGDFEDPEIETGNRKWLFKTSEAFLPRTFSPFCYSLLGQVQAKIQRINLHIWYFPQGSLLRDSCPMIAL